MDHTPSSSPDVAIIGGGIVGSFLAYYLAKSGRTVEVLDPSPGLGASAGNAGILALSYTLPMSNPSVVLSGLTSWFGTHRAFDLSRPLRPRTIRWLADFALASRPGRAVRDAPTVFALATRSLALYDRFASDEKVDLDLRRTGWLYVARTDAALEAQRKAAVLLSRFGVDHEVLNAEQLYEFEPGLGAGHVGGIHFVNDVSMDPASVTAAVASVAEKYGAHYRSDSVVSVEGGSASRPVLVTESGRRVSADTSVIAAGGDSADVAALFGHRIRVERGFGWNLTLPTEGPVARHALMSIEDHVVINPSQTMVRITGGMEFGGGTSTAVSTARIESLRDAAEELLPALRSIDAAGTTWRGARPMTPSGIPICARFGPGLIAVTGHGTLGMTLAPASAADALRLIDEGGGGPTG